MNIFILDTNIISYYLRGNGLVADNITKALMNGDDIMLAPIAYYEIKRGLLAVNSQKRLENFNSLCELFGVGQFNNNLFDVAAEIYVEQRKSGHSMEDADIFIAAFCLMHNFTLVTNNTKHFTNILGLSLIDWSVAKDDNL